MCSSDLFIYIAVRFPWQFGIGAVAGLLHDVALTFVRADNVPSVLELLAPLRGKFPAASAARRISSAPAWQPERVSILPGEMISFITYTVS